MRAVAVAAFLLLIVAPAEAQRGLTAEEKNELREAYTASLNTHLALEDLAAVELVTTTATRSAISTLWLRTYQAGRDANRGSLLLLGINPEGDDAFPCGPPPTYTGCPFTLRESKARTLWVSDAFIQHDGAVSNFTLAIAAADTASAIGGQVASYYTNLTATRAKLVTAKAALQGVNRTLTYTGARALPYCPDWTNPLGSCNVFGPHGQWILATGHLAASLRGLWETTNILRTVYIANGTEAELSTTTNAPIADFLIAFAKLLENITVVAYNFAIVPVTPTQCGFTPFHLVSRTIERMMQFGDTTDSITTPAEGGPIAGNPFYFTARGNMAANLNALAPDLATRPLTHALMDSVFANLLQNWRDASGGFWFAFEIPSDLNNYIIGQAFPRGLPSGTTAIPYTFGVTRSKDLRVYVRSVGSSVGRVPLVEGVGYTVSGIGNPAGGTVTLTAVPATGLHVQVERVVRTRLDTNRRQPYPENDPAFGSLTPCL
jgi:hypothetical protein